MRNLVKPPVFGGPLPSAPFFATPHREQPEEIAGGRRSETRSAPESQLARFAATRGAGKIGYGALAFWIVVATLVAARIAFLDPSRIEPTSSLFGAKAVPGWTTGGSPRAEN